MATRTGRTARGKCGHCEERTDVFVARHKGGGSYRKASRMYDKNICGPCARRLLEDVPDGPLRGRSTVAQWDIHSLRRIQETLDAAEAAGTPVPTLDTGPVRPVTGQGRVAQGVPSSPTSPRGSASERVPRGTPAGGQFTATQRTEAGVRLTQENR